MFKIYIPKLPKDDKDVIKNVLFILAATGICSMGFILFRIFPRLETVISRYIKRHTCDPGGV